MDDVSAWVMSLQDRLKVLREAAMVKGSQESKKRIEKCNKNAHERSLGVGGLVLLRILGLHGALEASWEGLYNVVEKLSKVNYRVNNVGGTAVRVVHISNTKTYVEREKQVNSVTVVAEEGMEMRNM